jgi:glutamyl-tRNA reductase
VKVQVVYCSHETAGLDVRERLAFPSEESLSRAYTQLRSTFPQTELVVLSTCNRVELYTAQEHSESAPTHQQLAQFLSEFHDIPLHLFFDALPEATGPEAVRHLFQVASGLDSMVLGEPQIVSQVKEAYRLAEVNESCGPLTNALFQRAIRVSKRVRTETKLAEGRISVASVAVGEFAKGIFDQFRDKLVLVIGAGEMAEETLRYLQAEGVGKIVVVNRSPDRAARLAADWGGTSQPFEELDRWLAAADVIVSTTGAQQPIVSTERFRQTRTVSGEKPVFILDLGAPRDFEPGIAQIDENVFLYDIDDLEATCQRNRQARAAELETGQRIIEEETSRFLHEIYHRATGPIIQRLREEWHEVRDAEVQRLFAKLSHLPAEDRDAIERSIERIVNKLLHPPLEALRDQAREGTPHSLLDALKRLFHLRD